MPVVATRAGGATASFANEVVTLEGGELVGIAFPMQEVTSFDDWDDAAGQADDCAAIVGLCLNQRFAVLRRAQFARQHETAAEKRSDVFRFPLYSGGKASVSARSTRSMIRAIDRLVTGAIAPQTLTALRWFEQSKRVMNGADRVVALWIALEALFPRVRTHEKLVRSTARELTKAAYGLGSDPGEIISALGLQEIRGFRNQVIHEGARKFVARDLPGATHDRDYPQILNDIVAEVLRHRLHATKTREVNRHFVDGRAHVQPTPAVEASRWRHLRKRSG